MIRTQYRSQLEIYDKFRVNDLSFDPRYQDKSDLKLYDQDKSGFMITEVMHSDTRFTFMINHKPLVQQDLCLLK